MSKPERATPRAPTDTVGSIFTARRDLLHGAKAVLTGSGFTVEEADLLMYLYGVRELGWKEPPHDADGYVAFKELGLCLVHNPSLLSRRIGRLAGSRKSKAAARLPPLVEVAGARAGTGLHFNALRVRITAEGIKRIQPVWERYRRLSAKLLEGIPQRLLETHYRVNQQISKVCREKRAGWNDLFRESP